MEHSTEILEKAEQAVYARAGEYGEAEDTFETIASFWNSYLRSSGIEQANISSSDVAEMMMLLKLARSVEGVYGKDNYADIAGYAENAARLHTDDNQ